MPLRRRLWNQRPVNLYGCSRIDDDRETGAFWCVVMVFMDDRRVAELANDPEPLVGRSGRDLSLSPADGLAKEVGHHNEQVEIAQSIGLAPCETPTEPGRNEAFILFEEVRDGVQKLVSCGRVVCERLWQTGSLFEDLRHRNPKAGQHIAAVEMVVGGEDLDSVVG